MQDVVIASAVRTPIGKLGGALSSVTAVDLGVVVLQEAVRRAGISPEDVQEVIMGHVIQAGAGPNPARQASLKAGFPQSIPAFTVNMVCASGMKAVALGALQIASGQHQVVLAGGMENMSAAPHLLPGARQGYALGDVTALDAILRDALMDPLINCHMGHTAENLSKMFGISRAEQDTFAALSQRKTGAALSAGWFREEIAPVSIPQRRGDPVVFSVDEFPRPDTTVEKLSALRPAFQPDGTVTAGNSSGINDGAAALVLMSADAAHKRGIKPLGTIAASASAALAPEHMGLGPVLATQQVLQKTGLKLRDIDVVELNEAFAAQALSVIRQLELDPDRINPTGGAIALGHPVGASGARIVVTLLHGMIRKGQTLGLATLCVGGGQGMAMVVKRT